ncbi:YgiQ family radical SAM protein [Halieaceae bacterium IMCC14734]|uniref:YgiQ family radical SAM protein n=1 Tax=Candidatus Litorirhabdus singularis TaxID=2518993 RepID=A0ABT3TGX1_9GAMM|nr:YgiQ family radical SAM protein [Candidatus Litorirhabdus singularis]MCX2981519.1 YgiQ family radical SAM protein [Candidatus Litorirhabdus singularis]
MNAPVNAPRAITEYRKYWAECYGVSPYLPMSRAEMDALGWDSCDIIIVTGDAYVDHPSFGMAVIGRLLEAQGFRVGIISQPDWSSAEAFTQLGRPNLFFGVAAGNMDSMINHYTADRKRRNDDAYTAGNVGGKRPDRAVIVYSQRIREAYKNVPLVIGGIEASLRRIAHYDYWSEKIRRSVLLDARADILLYGNAERAIVDLAHRLANGDSIHSIRDLRGTAYVCKRIPDGWQVLDSSDVDVVGAVAPPLNPYAETGPECATGGAESNADSEPDGDVQAVRLVPRQSALQRSGPTVIRLPAFEQVRADSTLYAHASRILHKETNPHNASALVQAHGDRELWLNPPPIPLTTEELDWVFEQPFQRTPHPVYGDAKITAYEMIRFSVNIMRGCFGGCTFCSITEHEGRIIQNRSQPSIIREVEQIRDKTPGFTGVISDLGGPTANMWRLACKSREIEASCRKLSCVYPGICKNLNTDQTPLIELYREARAVPGVKKVLIASGLRYDIAVKTPAYVKELVTHHVGGYLKIAPEHTEQGPLSTMMKPGIGTYETFRKMFEKYSKEAGKKQYLIPYFIAAHPGTTDTDMMNLALWLKQNGFRADQVQTFYPSPMASATAMYHSGRNTLKKISRQGDMMPTVRGLRQRRLHKAFLRYHDPDNWPQLRQALQKMGRRDLIGSAPHQLIPARQPAGSSQRAGAPGTTFATQHNGLPRTPEHKRGTRRSRKPSRQR